MISIVLLSCIAIVAIEIVILIIVNKKNREMHDCIRAASNIARDLQLEVMLRNPYAPKQESEGAVDLRNFICLTQIHSQIKHQYVYSLNSPICIGRAKSNNQLILKDDLVSEYHCLIYLQQDGVYLRDLNSANGTVVKAGIKSFLVANGGSMMLQNDNILIIGTMEYTVKIFELEDF